MFPCRERAIEELAHAEKMNLGLWINHSYNAANAEKIIA